MMQQSITQRLSQRLWRGAQAPLPCVHSAISDRPIMKVQPILTLPPSPLHSRSEPAQPILAAHLIGKQFLNSPHGLFYGSYDQIAITTAGLYKSRFSDGTRQGGCDTCHDVHQTTVVKMYPIEYPEEVLPWRAPLRCPWL